MRVIVAFSIIFALTQLAGCQQPLPTYASMSADETLETLRNRFEAMRTVSGGCTITFTSDSGESLNLDGALAARRPDWLRLRAWKFNTAVFDVTITPEGRWLYISEDANDRGGAASLDVNTAHIADAWNLINGGFFEMYLSETATESDATIGFRTAPGSEPRMLCIIARRTMVPLEYIAFDQHEAPVLEVHLEEYKIVNEVPWAHRLKMTSPNGRIEIHCSDVEINSELAERAFVPPRQAERLP